MNIDNRLYDLSLKLYKEKIWSKLTPDDLFAVPLSKARTGYVSIIKNDLGYKAAMMYIGQEGIDSLRNVMNVSYPDFGDAVLHQRGLSVSYREKEDLPDKVRDAAKSYEKTTGKRFPKKGWPVPLKAVPGHADSSQLTEDEQTDLLIMLEYTLEMSDHLNMFSKKKLGFAAFDPTAENIRIPKIELINGFYQISKTAVPSQKIITYKPVIAENEVLLQKLRKIKKRGILMCQLGGCLDDMYLDDHGCYPTMIFAVKQKSRTFWCDFKTDDYEEHPEQLLDRFLRFCGRCKYVPVKFIARNEKTAAFLEDAARKLSCSLEICEDLPALDEKIDEYMSQYGMDTEIESYDDEDELTVQDTINLMEAVTLMPDEFFMTMPPEIRKQFDEILNAGILPDDIMQKLKKRLKQTDAKSKKSGTRKKKHPKSSRSYVISVSPYTGCYRHIRVATDIPLSELASVILDVFGFDTSHLYSFFMDNRVWSGRAEYGRDPEQLTPWTQARAAADYTLEEALWRDDGKFLFLYDYGDEWRFQCRILREIPEPTDGYIVVRKKGDTPEQYPGE